MYDHIGLKVKKLDASVRFYEAALKPLGYVLCSRDDSGAGFGPNGEGCVRIDELRAPVGNRVPTRSTPGGARWRARSS